MVELQQLTAPAAGGQHASPWHQSISTEGRLVADFVAKRFFASERATLIQAQR
jgi:hypothetical protein